VKTLPGFRPADRSRNFFKVLVCCIAVLLWAMPGFDSCSTSTATFMNGTGSIITHDVVAPTPAQALDISTRLRVEIGDKVMIAGFIITGNAAKPVVLRGIGPSLVAFGVPDRLMDPVLELRACNGALIMKNDNWKDDQRSQIEGTVYEPTDDRESVIVAILPPGTYTAILTGKNGTTGVGLVEIYDNNAAADSELANISTRGFIQTGPDVMIAGFILGNSSGNSNIAVLGIGPSLAQFGLSDLLADPTLALYDSNGTLLISNDDWTDDPIAAAELFARGLAPQDPKESGIFTLLPPGQFTAILGGKNGGVGIGLIEIYDPGSGSRAPLPPCPTPTPAGTCTENFDGVAAPALPAGWVATNAAGPAPLWVTSSITSDSAPNNAVVKDPPEISDKRLDTPGIAITSASAQLSFRNNFNLETSNGIYRDGGVLEVSAPNINGGAFTDITDPAVGGAFAFVLGGYTGTISPAFGSPIAGRMAWSGNSGGYIDTVVNLGPNVDGQTIKLRFRLGTDQAGAGVGWRIDTISITGGSCL
jgi:hypothetical protein